MELYNTHLLGMLHLFRLSCSNARRFCSCALLWFFLNTLRLLLLLFYRGFDFYRLLLQLFTFLIRAFFIRSSLNACFRSLFILLLSTLFNNLLAVFFIFLDLLKALDTLSLKSLGFLDLILFFLNYLLHGILRSLLAYRVVLFPLLL